MKTVCVIPARYASTRLPGKPLVDIGGKPMIRRVYEQAQKARAIDEVIIATDDERIRTAAHAFGARVAMTDPALPSGTDRVFAAIKSLNVDVVINLQGDEPFVDPGLLDQLADMFANPAVSIATPISPVANERELSDPNLVRVVRDSAGRALYFSRAVIPFVRDTADVRQWRNHSPFYKHIGIYAYRKTVLEQLTQLPPSVLEKAEKLEQLRFLENGFTIHTLISNYDSLSVDTARDLESAIKKLNQWQES